MIVVHLASTEKTPAPTSSLVQIQNRTFHRTNYSSRPRRGCTRRVRPPDRPPRREEDGPVDVHDECSLPDPRRLPHPCFQWAAPIPFYSWAMRHSRRTGTIQPRNNSCAVGGERAPSRRSRRAHEWIGAGAGAHHHEEDPPEEGRRGARPPTFFEVFFRTSLFFFEVFFSASSSDVPRKCNFHRRRSDHRFFAVINAFPLEAKNAGPDRPPHFRCL